MDKESFEIFKKKAEKNRMFIRASKFKKLNSEQKKEVRKAVERSKKAYRVLYEVQRAIERTGTPFVIFKTTANYPDMGLDVDFLVVREDVKNLTEMLLKKFNGKIKDQSIASDLAGKISLILEGSPVYIELHRGRFSQIGEATIPSTQIVKNSILANFFGKNYHIPSHEDELLITVLHRIYRHLSVRFSDVYNVKRILDKEKLNWNYILKNAKKIGILPGLLFLLDLTEKYGADVGNMEKFPYFLGKRDFIKIYSRKVASDVVNVRIGSFLRMITIYPFLLLLESLFGKYFVNKFW